MRDRDSWRLAAGEGRGKREGEAAGERLVAGERGGERKGLAAGKRLAAGEGLAADELLPAVGAAGQEAPPGRPQPLATLLNSRPGHATRQ